jgi:uncharacterized protein with NAD-binding domain and iron-sulfur cluster
MKKIIIIGGGISGLVCAHKLVDKGFNIVLYEKEDVLGGMARGKKTEENIPIEHSWRGFGPFYHNLYKIMKEIPLNIKENFTDSYPLEEIEKHNTKDSLWTYYDGNVYDITDYIDEHPGGSIILNCGGKNLSDVWESNGVSWHNNNSYVIESLKKYKIGTVVEEFTENNTKGINVYSNLNKDTISFYLFNNKNESYKKPNINKKDYIYLFYLYLKVSCTSKRKKNYMKVKLVDYIKNNLCKDSYNFIVNFLSGPGYGFDINSLSVGHFFFFVEFSINEGSNYDYWRTLNGPINETWFKPWKNYLESKGVKINLNSQLTKINYSGNVINNLSIKLKNNQIFNVSADEYILCINPESLINILFDSGLNNIAKKHLKFSAVNNQVSFRVGFKKKINFRHMSGFILLDSPYNITLHSYSDHWKNYKDFGMNNQIKTLISGTLVRTYQKGSLYSKSALNMTKNELLDEIIHQIFSSKQLINFLKDKNNGYVLSKSDIIHKSIFEDWTMKNGRLKVENKKWINTIKNESNRIDNKTEFNNLFIGGSHTKTTTNIWLMEGAAESGLMVSNLILEKYNKDILSIYTHESSFIINLFKKLDDILYFFNLFNIIDFIIYLILVYIVYLLAKKK